MQSVGKEAATLPKKTEEVCFLIFGRKQRYREIHHRPLKCPRTWTPCRTVLAFRYNLLGVPNKTISAYRYNLWSKYSVRRVLYVRSVQREEDCLTDPARCAAIVAALVCPTVAFETSFRVDTFYVLFRGTTASLHRWQLFALIDICKFF